MDNFPSLVYNLIYFITTAGVVYITPMQEGFDFVLKARTNIGSES
jgi:hypothetical protein